MEPELVFGLKDGKLTHVSEVESGLICGCFCPQCGKCLVAKKGDIKVHHFAHEDDSDCQGALESALHLEAKEILEREKRIVLPSYEFDTWIAFKSFVLEFDEVKLEHHYENIIPDVLVYKHGRPLIVEIKVSHAVDDIKLYKLKKLGISAIEVDLSDADCSTIDSINHSVINNTNNRKWLFNTRESEFKAQIERRKERCRIPSWAHFEGIPMMNVWHCPLTNQSAVCDDCKHRLDWYQSQEGEDDYNSPKFVPNYVYCEKRLERNINQNKTGGVPMIK